MSDSALVASSRAKFQVFIVLVVIFIPVIIFIICILFIIIPLIVLVIIIPVNTVSIVSRKSFKVILNVVSAPKADRQMQGRCKVQLGVKM